MELTNDAPCLAMESEAEALLPEYDRAVLAAIRHIGHVLAGDPRGSMDEAARFVARALRLAGSGAAPGGHQRVLALASVENWLQFYRPGAIDAEERLNAVTELLWRALRP